MFHYIYISLFPDAAGNLTSDDERWTLHLTKRALIIPKKLSFVGFRYKSKPYCQTVAYADASVCDIFGHKGGNFMNVMTHFFHTIEIYGSSGSGSLGTSPVTENGLIK